MNAESSEAIQHALRDSYNICRFCGEQSKKLIGIYSEEGIQNEIPKKIELYLPIKLSQSDELPLECCWDCVSIIHTWDKFLQKAVETTERLKNAKEKFEETKDFESNAIGIQDVPISDISRHTEIANRHSCIEDLCNLSDNTEGYESSENISTQKIIREIIDVEKFEAVTDRIIQNDNDHQDYLTEAKQISQEKKCSKIRRKKIEVQDKFFCELCNKGFTRKFDMQRHMKSKHPGAEIVDSHSQAKNTEILSKCRISVNGETIYECDICKHRTNQSYNLVRHRTIHTGDRPYVCHICGNSFRLDSSFRKHIKHFHEGEKKYKCEICQKEFGMKSSKDEHMNIHSGLRPFSCNICQKSFKQKSSLNVHKLYHTNNFKFECSLCDKKFRRAQELLLHKRIHTGDKPHSCEVCEARFRLRQDLKKHKKIHLRNKKEWVCQDCQSVFSEERYLKLHRRIHV